MVLSEITDETLFDIAKILGGEDGIKIIKILKENDDITVEEISQKTDIQVNNVRKLLYKFNNHSLVISRRFRDNETGWFIFQWRLQTELVDAYIKNMKKKILKKLEDRLNYERQHEFYYCGNPTCPKTTFETAMDTVFHCPNCEEPLERFDNKPIIEFLEKKITKLKEELTN